MFLCKAISTRHKTFHEIKVIVIFKNKKSFSRCLITVFSYNMRSVFDYNPVNNIVSGDLRVDFHIVRKGKLVVKNFTYTVSDLLTKENILSGESEFIHVEEFRLPFTCGDSFSRCGGSPERWLMLISSPLLKDVTSIFLSLSEHLLFSPCTSF